VFRSDLGMEASLEELENLSNNKRKKFLDGIKAACQDYITNTLRAELVAIAKQTMEAAGKDPSTLRIVSDDQDPDGQGLLIHYPSALERDPYLQPFARIESGAKSAVDPNENKTIAPYVAPDFAQGNLSVTGVTTIIPERTFLDKILILHGATSYYDARGALRGAGRISRHYYDVHRLMDASIGETACADNALIEDCVRHAKMFFDRNDAGFDTAKRSSFRLSPSDKKMLSLLRQDYNAMSTMIFGEVPNFDVVLESIARAEERLNAT
jgi:hypothetical protein